MASTESDSFLGDIVSSDEVTGQLKVVTEIHASEKSPFRVLLGERMGKRVIIKTLKAKHAGNRQYLLMLRKEFEIGVSLSHPGIVSTLDYQIVEDLGESIIEEFIDGDSLETLLKRGEITSEKAFSILRSLTDALEYIHKKRIIHADLKPSNIIVSHFYGMPKIIDFGFSDSPGYVSLRVNGGTSHYIAPERREVDYIPTPASDIWSMGEIIDNIADKVKGKEKRRLRKIASECKKPLGERISSATSLRSLLDESGKKKRRIAIITGIAVIFTILFGLALNFIIDGYVDKENKSEIIDNPVKEEVYPMENEEAGAPNTREIEISNEIIPENPVESYLVDNQSVQSLNDRRNSNSVVSTEQESNFSFSIQEDEYTKDACEYAYKHIQQTINELKEKGLYKKAETIGEIWNSRYVYDEIISNIRDYVNNLPISSVAMRNAVKEKTIDYARGLLAEEEKKLENPDVGE